MPSKPPAVYWDSCCFIARIQRESERMGDLEQLTKLAEDKKLLIVTSTVTIAEVLREPDTDDGRSDGFTTIAEYFEQPWIVVRTADRKTAEEAAKVRRLHNLKLADAIHVATALRWKVRAFHTYDDQHLLPKDGKIGDPPLSIILPRYPEDYPLFDSLGGQDQPPILKFARTGTGEEVATAPVQQDQAGSSS